MIKIYPLYHFITLIVFLFNASLFGQYIPNPSFEGPPGFSLCPPEWAPCDSQSTPDTGPVSSTHITQAAADKSTYLVLVTRGDTAVHSSKYEDIQTQLYKPLLQNTDYQLSVYLALSTTAYIDTGKSGKLWLNHPVKLRIYGGVSSCEKTELLAETGAIDHSDWEKYTFTIRPSIADYNYLILEAYFVQMPIYFGNILIDNINIQDNHPVTESFIPNVITPNGDGHNDEFHIDNLIRDCSLDIFDRWGNLVFHTSDYDNSWQGTRDDGSPLESGNYWYVLKFPDDLGIRKGSIYVKRGL